MCPGKSVLDQSNDKLMLSGILSAAAEVKFCVIQRENYRTVDLVREACSRVISRVSWQICSR